VASQGHKSHAGSCLSVTRRDTYPPQDAQCALSASLPCTGERSETGSATALMCVEGAGRTGLTPSLRCPSSRNCDARPPCL
jgi:hypothetical protein